MCDIPYADWFAYIEQLGIVPGLLIDVFSGTGALAKIAHARGFRAISLDLSHAMLRCNPGPRVQALAEALPLASGVASVCTATNCSINYLLSYQALRNFFAECRRVLITGGLLALDFCPAERAWALHNRRFKAAGLAVFFHSYDPRKALLESQVVVGTFPHSVMEIHRQRIFTHEEITQGLTAAGFAGAVFVPNYGLPVIEGVAPIMTLSARAA